ncbi:hypothetical protein OG331_38145 [Streptomyces sp. NBC_01017]|uniref:hypothetical protein n=1 Tax=Streptomyces sp. NBC_01017 TaxID=2903721 RepID=UPI00386CA8EA|nr:hypothetical protein OG331_38145 [Streptomyces sp. NBC_01017]
MVTAIYRDVTAFLDGWIRHPTADAHVVQCVRHWLDDLLSDASPLSFWIGDGEDAAAAELQSWPATHAPARLRAQGEPDLATRVELLALPYDERWAHPYWTKPSVTN